MWRDTPESMNLLPDLTRPRPAQEEENAPLDEARHEASKIVGGDVSEVSFTREQASKTGIFWAIVLMQFSQNTLWQACHLHLLDVLALKGLDAHSAESFYFYVAIARTVVSLLFSFWVIDRLGRFSYLLLVLAVVPMLIVTLLLSDYLGPQMWHAGTADLLGWVYGIWGGMNTAASSVVFAQLFGRKHIGAISGLAVGSMRVSGAIGPLFFGLIRDWTGSYVLALKVLMLLTVVATAMLSCAPLPQTQAGDAQNKHVEQAEVVGVPTCDHAEHGELSASANSDVEK
eukprot:TRINITY_DN31109_c0_g1_i1.p1 TRINITY_DN31109_c0_g1~~TRINITY_DN31109_c0_g1_i1.p1  ORF type:complete len:286 (-),score=37.18 TRINITY_DN31109_c0_g1_i1:101-958(-)